MELIKVETNKTPLGTVQALKQNASDYGFVIRKVFDIKEEFKDYGVKVDEDFEYYSVMVCNPTNSYPKIREYPTRGALIFQPKQIVVFRENGQTVMAYAAYQEKELKELLPEDIQFQQGMPTSCQRVAEMIKSIA
ncbi:MAG: DUF302 domain-containing protein [Candidatus Nanoarchaeia archaeon]